MKGMEYIGNASEDAIRRRGTGEDNFRWQPGEGIANSGGSGSPDPNRVTPVGFKGWSCIPSILSVWGPGCTVLRLDVNKHSNAGRSYGRAVVVEGAIKLGVSGEFGVDARPTQQI